MPALPQLYPYKAGSIEPIVMPGENVGIWVNKVYNFFRVDFIEPTPQSDPICVNLGALAAAAVSAVTQLNLLEMPMNEFGQFRCEVLDDVEVTLNQGRADQRHKLATRVATLSLFTAIADPCGHTTEFYVFYNNWAFLTATNQTAYALAQARVGFWGYRYVLEPLTEYSWSQDPAKRKVPASWTRVPATAHL